MRKLLLLIAILLISTSGDLHAKSPSDEQRLKEALLMCQNVSKYMDRLSCFDNLVEHFRLRENAGQIEIGEEAGLWTVQSEVSALDDMTTVYLKLESDTNVILTNGMKSRPVLIIKCGINLAEAYVFWGLPMGLNSKRKGVITRIDRHDAQQLYWDISSDTRSMFHPDPVRFIQELINGHVLTVATNPPKNSIKTLKFVLDGLPEAIREIKDDCGW